MLGWWGHQVGEWVVHHQAGKPVPLVHKVENDRVVGFPPQLRLALITRVSATRRRLATASREYETGNGASDGQPLLLCQLRPECPSFRAGVAVRPMCGPGARIPTAVRTSFARALFCAVPRVFRQPCNRSRRTVQIRRPGHIGRPGWCETPAVAGSP